MKSVSVSRYRPHRVIGRFLVSREKRELLESYGWYRNMHGGWTHPHAMDYMNFWEIWKFTPKQLEYKLKHGSCAILPADLQ